MQRPGRQPAKPMEQEDIASLPRYADFLESHPGLCQPQQPWFVLVNAYCINAHSQCTVSPTPALALSVHAPLLISPNLCENDPGSVFTHHKLESFSQQSLFLKAVTLEVRKTAFFHLFCHLPNFIVFFSLAIVLKCSPAESTLPYLFLWLNPDEQGLFFILSWAC